MKKAGLSRLVLPILPAIIMIALLFINAEISISTAPIISEGVLDLSSWDEEEKSVFNLSGEFEFYWDELLISSDFESQVNESILVEAPDIWNYYEIEGSTLPGFGKATYLLHVVNAPENQEFAIRIQNMASAYRLYIDDKLIAQNGDFGDSAWANISMYRPQFSSFQVEKNSFYIILQVSNDAYSVGGMWEPIMFGLSEAVHDVNNLLKIIDYLSIGSLIVMSFFFLTLFLIVRREKEMLILFGMGFAVIVSIMEYGDVIISYVVPLMPIAGFGWIDYISQTWIQFLLLYFVYTVFSTLVSKWHIRIMLVYSAFITIFVLTLPFELISSTYMVMSLILLITIICIVYYSIRAVMKGMSGARSLLAVMMFILVYMLYEFFVEDLSILFFILNGWAIDFALLFFVQCTIVARRYKEARRIELSLLKNQIKPHFIHNALATIISISRKDSERSRELLMDFSSYLRACYDYEDNDDLIPIEQELEFVRAYVALEQARFGEKLKVEYLIETPDIVLPPLILQPLVENAFVHGLREKPEGGTVIVYSKRGKGGMIRIGVSDDGIGLRSKPKDSTQRQGIGIGNINRRLSRLYNTQLIYVAPVAGGCDVYMEIPYREVKGVEGTTY